MGMQTAPAAEPGYDLEWVMIQWPVMAPWSHLGAPLWLRRNVRLILATI